MDAFGPTLAYYCGRQGITLKELAKDMQVCRNTLTNWKAKGRPPSQDIAARLAKLLNLNEEETDEFLASAGYAPKYHAKKIETASSHSVLDAKLLSEFEKKYRRQISKRHGWIVPPDFNQPRKVPIDQLYVAPQFMRRKGEKEVLTLPALLSHSQRVVILGNPGAGKSTFAFKLCYSLATHPSQLPLMGRQDFVPILVVLREYGAKKHSHDYSILQFIKTKVQADYQIEPPPGAIEALLQGERAVVIFDGLDELLDTSSRQEISRDVESFCHLYPALPVYITSREVGYEQAPLDETNFEIFHLNPFNEMQVQEYITKWFNINTDLIPEEKKMKIEAFLKESYIVPDLRSNPLMLALMCNIYRGENYIPRNRPEVYEKCATMLFERWDKSRGIHVTLPLDWHISPMMKYLAHWIYTSKGLREGVTERRLIAKATEYLRGRRFEDRDEAEYAALQFIDFCCKGRAWVFTDSGTTKEGERLYQFTHPTFLEFFTAAYLERTCETLEKLLDNLLPKISHREWDNVAQLAFQLRSKNSEDAGDRLLTALIKQANEVVQSRNKNSKLRPGKVSRLSRRNEATPFRNKNSQDKLDSGDGILPSTLEWNILSFAARCLEFIVPSPKITRNITKACIDYVLTCGLEAALERNKLGNESERQTSRQPIEIIGSLLCATTENRAVIADCFERELTERVTNSNDSEALLALEVGLLLNLSINRRVPKDVEDFWQKVSDRILNACSKYIEKLLSKSVQLCHMVLHQRKGLIGDLIKWHGVESLFLKYPFTLFPSVYSKPLAEILVKSVMQSEKQNRLIDQLKDLGRILLHYPPPWIKAKLLSQKSFMPRLLKESELLSQIETLDLDPDALFGAFIVLATFFESSSLLNKLDIEAIKSSKHPLIELMRVIFIARLEKHSPEMYELQWIDNNFTDEQKQYIWKWSLGEINFIVKEQADFNEEPVLVKGPSSSVKKILIVDDDPTIADLLREALADAGYEAYMTTQSLRALDAIRQISPSLLLLDMMMQYLDGRDIMRLINTFDDLQQFPILIVTAYLDLKLEKMEWYIDASKHPVRVIYKPFDLDRLLDIVKEMLQDDPVPNVI